MNFEVFDIKGNKLDCKTIKKQDGDFLRYSFIYNGEGTVFVKNAVFDSITHNFSSDCKFFGEGYNMLSQYHGTIENPKCVTEYSDKDRYKLPNRDGFFTVYSMFMAYTNTPIKLEKPCDVFCFFTDDKLCQNVTEFDVLLDARNGKVYQAIKI